MAGRDVSDGLAALPDASPHWTLGRKLLVVVAVSKGRITAPEACERYMLSLEELAVWIAGYEGQGIAGLQQKHEGRRSS
jgi:hypothetical protein